MTIENGIQCDAGVTVILGAQWGDEGKGKLVDILAQSADVCARCQGGNNAGHTIHADGVSYDFHILPSGLMNPKCLNVVGSGCVVHLPGLFNEIDQLKKRNINVDNRIFLSDRTHLVFDYHQIIDGIRESELGKGNIGTTRKGIGPSYQSKANRSGLRVHDLLGDWIAFETRFRANVDHVQKRYGDFPYDVEKELLRYKDFREKVRPLVVDAVDYVHNQIDSKKAVLVEGANAMMLDIDFGTYPFVTSSQTGVGGVCTGLGVPPKLINKVWGLVKAYTTRVGSGPMPTEQLNENGEKLQLIGHEWGATTGRKRRCGWLDLVVVKYSQRINGYDAIMLSKLDVLDEFDEIKVGIAYTLDGVKLPSFPADCSALKRVEVEYRTFPGWKTKIAHVRTWNNLPKEAREYVKFIEEFLGVKIALIGVGPDREDIVEHSNGP